MMLNLAQLLVQWLPMCLILSSIAERISASKILLLPFPWKSHVGEFSNIGEALVARGHEVHILLPSHYPGITPFQGNNSNFKLLDFTAKYPDFHTFSEDDEEELFQLMIRLTPIEDFRTNTKGFVEVCYNVLEDMDLNDKIKAQDFDIVLTDAFTNTRCYYILLYRLNLPYISVSTQYEPWLFRTPALPSFVPFPLISPPLTPEMSFWERVVNLWTLVDWSSSTHKLIFLADSLVTKYAPDKPAVSINQLAGRSLLWLFDTDIAIDYPRPMMPNEVNIGGLSTKPAKPLPNDIEQFMDAAPEGVVLVSFGSHSAIPIKYLLVMLEAFKKVSPKVHFIFRYPLDNKPDVPANIKLLQWVPQNDILAHPKTKLFVTHCGANGQFEALYHGIPMLSFPSFADQPYNAKRAEYLGFAKTLDVQTFTVNELKSTVEKMLQDKTYSKNIKRASSIFKSHPMNPRERAAYWVEHILEFGGDHLHSHALDMPWYEYLMLDIFFCFMVICVAALWIGMNTLILCFQKFKHVRANMLASNGLAQNGAMEGSQKSQKSAYKLKEK